MSDDKIKISWDDVQSAPEPSSPPSNPSQPRESWGQVSTVANQASTSGGSARTSLMYRAWFYLGLAGILAGLLAWGLQEAIKTSPRNATELRAQIESVAKDLEKQDPMWARMTEAEQLNRFKETYAGVTRKQSAFWMAIIAAAIAAGLGVVDGLVNRSPAQAARGLALGLMGGAIGGFIAGYLAQWLYASLLPTGTESNGLTAQQVFARAAGWAIAGCLACAPLGLAFMSVKRCVLAALGGLLGGLMGGLLFDLIGTSSATDNGSVSRFVGIVGIGVLSGLFISLAEEVAKSAWLKIEAGRLIGKQFIIYRNPTRLGAAATNEVYLFKDTSIAALHALIERRGRRLWIVDQQSSSGTRVNGKAVREQVLRHDDLIQIGETRLRFGERLQE